MLLKKIELPAEWVRLHCAAERAMAARETLDLGSNLLDRKREVWDAMPKWLRRKAEALLKERQVSERCPPCPGCRGFARLVNVRLRGSWQALCANPECGLRTPEMGSRDQALTVWAGLKGAKG